MSRHHFTVDVEEYFHPVAMAPYYPPAEWPDLESRTDVVMPRLLDFLEERGVVGTFFVVGWLAERKPATVRAILDKGHEVASHGYEHELVERLGPDGFRDSVRRSKDVLEDIGGRPVLGYRAPSFSIIPGLEWAFDVLLEEGYAYDASLFPVSQHPTYGYPQAPRDPHWIDRPAGRIVEVPATTARLLGMQVPASGGAYFRLLPYGLTRTGLGQAEARGAPGMFYVHPWELDSWAPEPRGPAIQRFRTFAGRQRSWARLERMLGDFQFTRVDRTVSAMRGDAHDSRRKM